mgnify:CR=1 FL=1
MIRTAIFTTTAILALGVATAQAGTSKIINNAGEEIGVVNLKQGPEGVLLNVDIKDLPPGPHGFHIHSVGTCEDHDAFKMAKGHIKEDDEEHGLLNPNGPEIGDLPNLIVPENGEVKVEFYVDDLEISASEADDADDEDVLLDADGSAFMIHADADDHMTQPIGGAGARIACGVIEK